MTLIELRIDFRSIDSHNNLIEILSKAFPARPGLDNVLICINLNCKGKNILYADYLLLIVSAVNYLRENGVTVSGYFEDFNKGSGGVRYSSRINFFQYLGFPYEEKFNRLNSESRFIEISRFNSQNASSLHDKIVKILVANKPNDDMLIVLQACLYEVIDNTLNHSGSGFGKGTGQGYISGQFFPGQRKIRIMIADCGQGIHKALTTHPKSKFKHYNEQEAVFNSVVKGVTNSEGMGFGLWQTAEMTRLNKGKLIIHSGNSSLECSEKKTITQTGKWQGTFTFMEINTDNPVFHKEIRGEDSTLDDDFNFLKEKILGEEDPLW